MNILYVTSEAVPFCKTGGDVYYSIAASKSTTAVILNRNDTVTIRFNAGEGAIIPASELEKAK